MFGRLRVASVLLIAACVAAAAEPTAKVYKGHLVIAPEAEVFRPCGSNEPLWLDYTKAVRASLFGRYIELRKKPYAETFVVLRGIPGPQLDCGYCEHFKGSFKVLEAIEQRASGPAECK